MAVHQAAIMVLPAVGTHPQNLLLSLRLPFLTDHIFQLLLPFALLYSVLLFQKQTEAPSRRFSTTVRSSVPRVGGCSLADLFLILFLDGPGRILMFLLKY